LQHLAPKQETLNTERLKAETQKQRLVTKNKGWSTNYGVFEKREVLVLSGKEQNGDQQSLHDCGSSLKISDT